jgi:hypothetical protein
MAIFRYFIFLFLVLNQICLSQNKDWIEQSIDYTINTQFSKAESLLTNRIQNGDTSLAVYFYYASVLNSKMTHFEYKEESQSFYNALQHIITHGEQQLDKYILYNDEKVKTLFYLGSAYGYLAFYQGQIGEWFSAVKNGSKAAGYLEDAVDIDSTLWDAYLGLGTYKYWRSTKIDWIPFIPDQREEGIELIKKTISHDSYSKYLAMHQLVYILLDFGQFDQAQVLAEEIVKAYPESAFMRWAHSHVFMKKKDLPKAIASYKTLLKLIDKDPNANPNHKVTCLGRLADMYARADSCEQVFQIQKKLSSSIYMEIVEENEEVQKLMAEISERCKKQEDENTK